MLALLGKCILSAIVSLYLWAKHGRSYRGRVYPSLYDNSQNWGKLTRRISMALTFFVFLWFFSQGNL